MNKERRQTLDAIGKEAKGYHDELYELVRKANQLIVDINDKMQEVKDNILGQIEEVRDEEQEYYDAMPESLQNGEKGDRANEAIEKLNEAIAWIEGLDDLDELSEYEMESEVVDALSTAAE